MDDPRLTEPGGAWYAFFAMTAYQKRTYLLAPEHEEIFASELWARGVLGCEIHDAGDGRLRLDAYFPDPPPPELARWSLDAWRRRGVEAVAEEPLADRDWLEEYRAAARPFEVGRTFLVDPRDPPGETSPGGRRVLRIPARTAFGTGSHESTRLAVEWLEDLDLAGLDVLDVGTGSGILAFAALELGARRVVGFDVDAPSVLVAGQNSRLNHLWPRLFAGRLAALAAGATFDLALVNILPERIREELPRLLGVLASGGRWISSGNLWRDREELTERFVSCGSTVLGEKRHGEWVAFLCSAPLDPPKGTLRKDA